MSWFLKIFFGLLLIGLYITVPTVIGKLLTASSDAEVTAGFVILAACLASLFITIPLLWQWYFMPIYNWLRKHPTTTMGLLILIALSGCTKAPPGEVGILVNYYGSNRGVQDVAIKTGRIWYNPFTEEVLIYPTFVQTAIWTHDPNEGSPRNEEITYNSSEGLTFSADISLAYHLEFDKVPAFYVKFRSDDLKVFTNGYLHNVARDAFNEVAAQYTTTELYSTKKDLVLKEVRDRVNELMKSIGVVIDQFGYIGSPRPPVSVINAINAKIKAIQDAQAAQNKVAQIKAEAEQRVAEADGRAKAVIALAEGQAKANQLVNSSLTPNLILWQAVEKWDGRRPMVEGGGSGLLLNVTPETIHK